MKKEAIRQSALSVVVPIKSGEANIQSLKNVLAIINEDQQDNDYMPFSKLKTIHFARWFIVNNAKNSDGRLLPNNLIFTSNFDGHPDDHISLIVKEAHKGIDAIYRHCEQYPQQPCNADRVDFLQKHRVKEKLFWSALRGTTVTQVYKDDHLWNEIQKLIDNEKLFDQPALAIRERIIDYVSKKDDLKWALEKQPSSNFLVKVLHWGNFAINLLLLFSLVLGLLITLILPIWVVLGRIMEVNLNKKGIRSEQREEQLNDLISLEDHHLQNQFVVYGTIKKPRFYRRLTLELVLWVFRLNGKYLKTKGILGGIDSIHFARWIVFNKGKNLSFLSNYDGAWENYLTEFVDHSSEAMNLTFGSMIGYPKTKWLIGEGSKDELAFKHTARNNQYPCQVWYSAYPHLSAKDIMNNISVRNMISKKKPNSKEIKDWLRKF